MLSKTQRKTQAQKKKNLSERKKKKGKKVLRKISKFSWRTKAETTWVFEELSFSA